MFREKSDSEKLRYLVETFGGSMYAVADRILRDSHMAEDVVQEVLIRVSRDEIMEKIDTMDETALRSYLLITAKNIALNFYAKRRREAGITIGNYNEEAVNNISVEDSADVAIRKIEEENLFEIVDSIPERYSSVLIMKYKHEMSDNQIAASCGITKAAVRKRLERGRKMVLDKMKKRHYLDDDDLT